MGNGQIDHISMKYLCVFVFEIQMNVAWEGLNRTWRERMERLEEAMTASVQYQDALQVSITLMQSHKLLWLVKQTVFTINRFVSPQGMFDYLDNAVIKLCDMPAVGTDLSTVKQQIEELKVGISSCLHFSLVRTP